MRVYLQHLSIITAYDDPLDVKVAMRCTRLAYRPPHMTPSHGPPHARSTLAPHPIQSTPTPIHPAGPAPPSPLTSSASSRSFSPCLHHHPSRAQNHQRPTPLKPTVFVFSYFCLLPFTPLYPRAALLLLAPLLFLRRLGCCGCLFGSPLFVLHHGLLQIRLEDLPY